MRRSKCAVGAYLGVPYCSDGLGEAPRSVELVFEAVDAADLQVLS